MARIYSGKKGKSGSKKPPFKVVPKWVTQDKESAEKIIVDLAKQKYSSARIGTVLRDTYGVPDAALVANKTITKIMQENKLYPELPEDMMFLLKKAVELRKHMSSNKKDKHSKRGLDNLESKIRRLSKYYTRENMLPKGWVYDPEKARLIIEKW